MEVDAFGVVFMRSVEFTGLLFSSVTKQSEADKMKCNRTKWCTLELPCCFGCHELVRAVEPRLLRYSGTEKYRYPHGTGMWIVKKRYRGAAVIPWSMVRPTLFAPPCIWLCVDGVASFSRFGVRSA